MHSEQKTGAPGEHMGSQRASSAGPYFGKILINPRLKITFSYSSQEHDHVNSSNEQMHNLEHEGMLLSSRGHP